MVELRHPGGHARRARCVWQWDATDHFDPVQGLDVSRQRTRVDGSDGRRPVPLQLDRRRPGRRPARLGAQHGLGLPGLRERRERSLWKMGGATYTKDGAPYIAVQSDPLTSFHRQHDVRFLPDGDHLDVRRPDRTPGPARAVIYSYDVTPATATMVWQYAGRDAAARWGASASSRTARASSAGGRAPAAGIRASPRSTRAGNDLLDFVFPDGDDRTGRSRSRSSAFDIGTLRATAGGR